MEIMPANKKNFEHTLNKNTRKINSILYAELFFLFLGISASHQLG